MPITLTKALASNASADPYDVHQTKKVLNRLGYYIPLESTGITETPDRAMFAGLKAFQSDQGLEATGELRPDDETLRALNTENEKKSSGAYIWRTVGDDKVRASHRELEGELRDFADSPDPGEDFNCRCWCDFNVSGEIEREELEPPKKPEAPNIPGTDIPDRGIPEQGFPNSPVYDPYKPPPEKNPDPWLERRPPRVDPNLPIMIETPLPSDEYDI